MWSFWQNCTEKSIKQVKSQQVIFFFLSEFWLLTTRLVSYNILIQIITCVLTIYPLWDISVGQNFFSFRFSSSLKIQSSSLKLALYIISISRMYIVIKFTRNKIPKNNVYMCNQGIINIILMPNWFWNK